MLTLPDTLTEPQLRRIDEAVHQALHPEQAVEWRWCYSHRDNVWKVVTQAEEDVSETIYHNDAFYCKRPCERDKTRHLTPIPSYNLSGVGNNEVAERMLVHDAELTHEITIKKMDGLRRVELDLWYEDELYMSSIGIGPDLPRAILACACDWWGIGIPKKEPQP